MTPITEDQVQSLMKGLEKREKTALKKLDDAGVPADAVGHTTARIFSFSRQPAKTADPVTKTGSVVPLESARAARDADRSRSGGLLQAFRSGQNQA